MGDREGQLGRAFPFSSTESFVLSGQFRARAGLSSTSCCCTCRASWSPCAWSKGSVSAAPSIKATRCHQTSAQPPTSHLPKTFWNRSWGTCLCLSPYIHPYCRTVAVWAARLYPIGTQTQTKRTKGKDRRRWQEMMFWCHRPHSPRCACPGPRCCVPHSALRSLPRHAPAAAATGPQTQLLSLPAVPCPLTSFHPVWGEGKRAGGAGLGSEGEDPPGAGGTRPRRHEPPPPLLGYRRGRHFPAAHPAFALTSRALRAPHWPGPGKGAGPRRAPARSLVVARGGAEASSARRWEAAAAGRWWAPGGGRGGAVMTVTAVTAVKPCGAGCSRPWQG